MNVIVTCEKTLSVFQLKVLKSLLESNKHNVAACIVDDRPQKTAFERLKKHLKKGRGGYVLVMALKSLYGRKEHRVNTTEFMKSRNIPVILTGFPYSKDTISSIERYKPDVIVLNGGFGIIKDVWLNLTKHGVVSYHHGDMRKYRGQPFGFWELYNGEKEVGVTVQRISAGLDCGEPIVEKKIPINRCDTLSGLRKRLYEQSCEMMLQAIELLEKDGFVPPKIERFGKVYTIPNLRQWLTLNVKIVYRFMRHKTSTTAG